MYPASEAFHKAVANGNEQKALLIFSDCVFTDADISIDQGIRFNDYFNTEEDIGIGQANSNEISFTLFNEKYGNSRLLNDYEFGDFLATLGVFLDKKTYTHYGNVTVNTIYAQYVGSDTYPFLLRNGTTLPSQPSFGVKSILAYDNKVWVFSSDGRYAVYNDMTGANITAQNSLNLFMRRKSTKWIGKGIFYNAATRILFIYEGGIQKRYEFVPLGWFVAERPKAPDMNQVDMDCYDFMQKFDEDMPESDVLGVSYPITIGNLFVKLCNFVGVRYKTSTFINSNAIIQDEPMDFESVTMREVLKWIAEAAGSNVRFDRDGVLVMDWLRTTDQRYTANGYSEFNPYWYQTKQVSKLCNRDTQDAEDYTYGGGDEEYLIQDNPLLRGVN